MHLYNGGSQAARVSWTSQGGVTSMQNLRQYGPGWFLHFLCLGSGLRHPLCRWARHGSLTVTPWTMVAMVVGWTTPSWLPEDTGIQLTMRCCGIEMSLFHIRLVVPTVSLRTDTEAVDHEVAVLPLDRADDSLEDSVKPMTESYTIKYFQYHEDVGYVGMLSDCIRGHGEVCADSNTDSQFKLKGDGRQRGSQFICSVLGYRDGFLETLCWAHCPPPTVTRLQLRSWTSPVGLWDFFGVSGGVQGRE